MNKSTKRPANDRVKTEAVHWVAKKCMVTPQYVYGILNGNNRITGRADEILEAYRAKYAELKQVLS